MSDFLLSLQNVKLAFGGPNILDDVSLVLTRGMRAAITGRNGEGKSTLMKVIAGLIEPDSGTRVAAPGLKVEYVAQEVQNELSNGRARSGGEIHKEKLEKALLSRPDLLLLDEPTNHLDIEAIDWLEAMIRRQRDTAVLIVTHDRRFLKHVAESILDLDRGELSGWQCDYNTFLKRKAELIHDEEIYWSKKAKELAKEEAWIRRGVKARTTRNEGRVARLLELRKEFSQRRARQGVSSMKLDTEAPGGEKVLKIRDISFGYQDTDRVLFESFTHDVLRGERIGILGANGAGKTSLLNVLTGRVKPTKGTVEFGTNIKMAFLDQFRGELNGELSVVENIATDRDEVVVGGVRKHVYSYLSDFLFSPERCRTPVKALSGGERARLMLARLFLEPANLLVMDEPTNDLDIETLELLEEQLLEYKGTLLLVSHDREFLNHVVTSTMVLEGDKNVRLYPGGYEDYEKQRKANVAAEKEQQKSSKNDAVVSNKPKRLGYMEKRELESITKRIDELEKKIASILNSSGSVGSSEYALIPSMQEELDKLMERWAELEERAEA
ncbi:MAG: ATP-binding cassette domain-containing protein [Kiritimatiellae bacterium]|nr:ATP-binding cassette domain-containing protein [Kiritimatiellia bacterium]